MILVLFPGAAGPTRAAEKVQEEPPAKLLDDLFRKTVALPCIYWLPLTEEQVRIIIEGTS